MLHDDFFDIYVTKSISLVIDTFESTDTDTDTDDSYVKNYLKCVFKYLTKNHLSTNRDT